MASGGRRSAGERVLESKHVIGLFLLMLLFSGVFFTLGYVMGRNQFGGEVSAATPTSRHSEPAYIPKSDPTPKKSLLPPVIDAETDPATSDKISDSGWVYPDAATPAKSEPHLDPPAKPVPATQPPATSKTMNAKAKSDQPSAAVRNAKSTTPPPPLVPTGAYLLQVAALTRQDDALAVASSLQKKHFPATVSPPQRDKFFRVQVGPFKDQKSADAAKKGLEGAGYKAFYVKH
jgi:DedD protein